MNQTDPWLGAYEATELAQHENEIEVAQQRARAASNPRGRRKPRSEPYRATALGGQAGKVSILDFEAYLPTHRYYHRPTGELWPAESVDRSVCNPPCDPVNGAPIKPSVWLDMYQPVHQMTWAPGEPAIVEGRLVHAGGWVEHQGARVINLYRPPRPIAGDPSLAGPWLEHLRLAYPQDAAHIIAWLAHVVQRPAVKPNHALVLLGNQGIGKDTLLEPVRHAVGPCNVSDVSPQAVLGRFNGWARSRLTVLSEAHDLGDSDRFKLYDHLKTYLAAPPHVIRVDEKNLREYPIFNVLGMVITSNHRTDGIYLPADDRRHYVASSDATKDNFPPAYWQRLWGWYEAGGYGHVAAYLSRYDLSRFDPKAPPPKTPAFYAIVQAGSAPEDGELLDVIEHAGSPAALTLETLLANARAMRLDDLALELGDRKNRRRLPHKLERAGYIVVRNPDASDGLWRVGDRRQAVYARKELPLPEQIRAARELP